MSCEFDIFFNSISVDYGMVNMKGAMYCRAGLEKSSVLPVLDRFLNLKTDFVLNRKQKNRSIKVRFFPSNSQ